jgi:hypothetical protein
MVIEKVGSAAYKLDLPNSSKVHPVFNILQLKEFIPDYNPVYSELLVQVDFSKEVLQPESILERRLVKKGNTAVPQVRAKWIRLCESASICEDWNVLMKMFPVVASRGQAAFQAGGRVIPEA